MRFTPRTWSLLSLLLFVVAAFFWLKGNEYQARKMKIAPAKSATNLPSAKVDLFSTKNAGPLAQLNGSATVPVAASSAGQSASDRQIDKLYPYRLRNTKKSLAALTRDDHALLLANALIDTASGDPVQIPEHLRAKGDPGSYIVQWNGPATPEFRQRLAEAGAEIISYVPNNAYYVRVDQSGAAKLQTTPGVQSVLAFEPYYKLGRSLLAAAVEQTSLAPEALLRLTLIPGNRDAAVQNVQALGAELLAEEPSPFGPQLVVHPKADSLAALAQLNSVQGIEPVTARKPAADLSRIALGVATNGSASNYLNLTGSNILVNINDTGIDTNNPDLKPVTTYFPAGLPANVMANDDPVGHGTFVAGLIAGSGAGSPTGTNVPPGSSTNALFRGMAPAAKLLALPLSTGGGSNNYPEVSEAVSDSWLIDQAARTNYLALKRTNSLISNNSWTYGRSDYDTAAARYDAAVRDAIPGQSGSQPLLFVFAAGNSGFGDDNGATGSPDSIETPATAKNVITVGALESPRFIDASYTLTNITTNTDGSMVTNTQDVFPFIGLTDSSNQVASFSSRGNVGIGIEGNIGRFKPDVVAPGAMLVSARSRGWNYDGFTTNDPIGQTFINLHTNLQPYRFGNGTTFAAANVSGLLALMQEYFETQAPGSARGTLSPALMKALLINGSRSLGENYTVATDQPINHEGWGEPNLPNSLSSYSTNDHKALQDSQLHLRFIEQSASNALATAESRTWKITLSSNATVFPFRVTLVWTDPPGNPAVGIKLVNDLDLIVTNTDSGLVYYGNFFNGGDFSQPVQPVPGQTLPFDSINNVENVFIRDPSQLGQNFTITVRARRVNVNSVADYLNTTRNTNDVVQDFALVVSSEMGADPSFNDPEDPNGYLPGQTVFETFQGPTTFDILARPPLTVITNGLPLLFERVGANATLVGTNGVTNQWSFYVFTNRFISNALVDITNGPYVAFATFDSPNLTAPPRQEADIDLYVSKDPSITNLNPAAITAAFKGSSSTERLGTETVTFTNSVIGDVFYVGVKSEDQQAGEYSLIGVSSQTPFQEERNGKIILNGVPYSSFVPDGTARKPSAGTMLAIGLSDARIARAVVSNTIAHENIGDLLGLLSHHGVRTVLNNHLIVSQNGLFTTNLVYDDNNFFPKPKGTRHTDGPGTLNDFVGVHTSGAWFLQEIDNAPSHTGRVQSLTIVIDALRRGISTTSSRLIQEPLAAGEIAFYPVDIAPGTTNLIFRFSNVTPPTPLIVYFRQNQLPQTNAYDLKVTNAPSGGDVIFPGTNGIPLQPGTHYLAVQNPTGTDIKFDLEVIFQFSQDQGLGFHPGALTNLTLLDDTTTNFVIDVPEDKVVAGVRVSVNMPHPRSADTMLSLISPQGTRVVVAEQRSPSNTLGYGAKFISTNVTVTNFTTVTNVVTSLGYTVFTDDTNLATLPIKFIDLSKPYGKTTLSNVFLEGFEGLPARPYLVGSALGAWQVITNVVTTGPSGPASVLAVGSGSAYEKTEILELDTNAAVSRVFNTYAGGAYKLSFAVRVAEGTVTATNSSVDVHVGQRVWTIGATPNWTVYTLDFASTASTNTIQFHGRSGKTWIDAVSVQATGDIFALPEEPFDPLIGQRAIGEWALEVRDARTGQVLPGGGLTWKLDLDFADPLVKVERLYNNSVYPNNILAGIVTPANPTNRVHPGTLFTNQVQYFSIEACSNTTSARVILRGVNNFDGVQLLADRSGIPTGDPETDDYVLQSNNENPGSSSGIATFVLTTNRPAGAPFEKKRFFIAIQNTFVDQTNKYELRVTFFPDSGCPQPLTAQSLRNGMTASSLLGGIDPDVQPEPDSDVFEVNVAPDAKSLTLDVQGDGDLAILAQKGSPPTMSSFSHSQNTPGSGNEQLVITSNSGVPLTSGTWYVRVLNNSTFPSAYTITATGDILDPASLPELQADWVNGQLHLTWNSVAGASYQVEASDNLQSWTSVGAVTASGDTTSFMPPPGNSGARFYRLVLQ